MDGIPFVLQQVGFSAEGIIGEEENQEVKVKFFGGNDVCFGALEFGVGRLFSIQNIVVCLCSVKPLLILYKSDHGVKTAA